MCTLCKHTHVTCLADFIWKVIKPHHFSAVQTLPAIKHLSHTKKGVQSCRQSSHFVQWHYRRLGVCSHLQGELLVLVGEVCAVQTGQAGGGTGLPLQWQCLYSKNLSPFALGTGHTAFFFFFPNAFSMLNNQIYLIQCKQHLFFSWLPFPRQWCPHSATGAHPVGPHSTCLDTAGCAHAEHCPTWMQEWTKLGTAFS